MTKTQQYLLLAVAVLLAVGGTAIASSYITQRTMEQPAAPIVAQTRPLHRAATPHPQYTATARPHCEDHNIVGTVGGAVVGGLVGSQFGKGNGRGLATAGGAVAGGALGNAYVPTRGATCD